MSRSNSVSSLRRSSRPRERSGTPPRSLAIRAADGGAFVLGSRKASSSRTIVANWKGPILEACSHGDARSLKIMWKEATLATDSSATLPTADEMIQAAISEGRVPIVKDIHDLFPPHEWSDETFGAAMLSDMEARGNHYLLAYSRWSQCPLTVHGKHGDALMWAVRLGDLESGVVLLSWGADPNGCKWSNQWSHLQVAVSMHGTARTNFPTMVNLLIKYGANVRNTGIMSWVAGTCGYLRPPVIINTVDTVKYLLHNGADVNEVPPPLPVDELVIASIDKEKLENAELVTQQVPLIAATMAGSLAVIYLLFSHKADHTIRHRTLGLTGYELIGYELASHVDIPEVVQESMHEAYAECGISPATLWGILQSDTRRPLCDCKSNAVDLDHDYRWVPPTKPDL